MSINPESDKFLTPEERDRMRRMLSFPEEFPPEFGSYITEWLAINGSVQRGQVQGLTRFVAKQDVPSTTSSTRASTAYGDLAAPAAVPELSGLNAGTYLVFFGGIVGGAAAGKTVYMSVAQNGAAAGDGDGFSYYNGAGPSFGSASMMRVLLVTFDKPSNTIRAQYRTGDGSTGNFNNSWLIALLIA